MLKVKTLTFTSPLFEYFILEFFYISIPTKNSIIQGREKKSKTKCHEMLVIETPQPVHLDVSTGLCWRLYEICN